MPGEGSSLVGLLIPFILMIGAMYLLIFLPQKKREKKTREMLDALKVGDKVVSIGGITGKIVNIKDDEITIETGVEKTILVFKKWAIKNVQEEITS